MLLVLQTDSVSISVKTFLYSNYYRICNAPSHDYVTNVGFVNFVLISSENILHFTFHCVLGTLFVRFLTKMSILWALFDLHRQVFKICPITDTIILLLTFFVPFLLRKPHRFRFMFSGSVRIKKRRSCHTRNENNVWRLFPFNRLDCIRNNSHARY